MSEEYQIKKLIKISSPESDKKTYEAGLDKAEHDTCVEISTQAAIKEMMLPGLLAILSPVIVGKFAGPEA